MRPMGESVQRDVALNVGQRSHGFCPRNERDSKEGDRRPPRAKVKQAIRSEAMSGPSRAQET